MKRVLLIMFLVFLAFLIAGCCSSSSTPDARKDAALLDEVGACVTLMNAWAPPAYAAKAKTLGENTNADLRGRLAPK